MSPRKVSLARLLAAGSLLLAAGSLVLASPVVAAEPDYLAEMPTSPEVIEKITGQDAFDTAARQYVAFSRLESMMLELIGDRLVAGEMTPAEKAMRDTYHDNYLRIQGELLASLPEGEREFRPDSRYGQWRALIDKYCCSEANLNDQLLKTFFSPTFLAAYGPIHAANEAIDPWAGFAVEGPVREPPPDTTVQTILSVLAVIVFVIFYLRGAIARNLGGYGRRRGD